MPSHPNDLKLVSKIETHINILIKHHPTNKIILAGNLNKDILLQRHIHEGTPQAPTREDKQWA
jgi:hypothetical protein